MKYAAWTTLVAFVVSFMAISIAANGQDNPAPVKAPAATQPSSQPTSAGAWNVVFKADFSGPKIDPKWLIISGTATVKDGVMTVEGTDNADGEVMYKDVYDAPSVRMEFTATFAKAEEVSDLSPILNATSDGFGDGYLFQCGGKSNTVNQIHKAGDVIDTTTNAKSLPLKPETKYAVVVENDNGNLKMTLNGQTVIEYKDDKPLSGKNNGQIGFYTWNDKLMIKDLVISTKGGTTTKPKD